MAAQPVGGDTGDVEVRSRDNDIEELKQTLYKEIDWMFSNTNVFDNLEEDQVFDVIRSKSQTYTKQGVGGNALTHAVQMKSYSLARRMLQQLNQLPGPKTDILLEKNGEGNNALQVLLSNIALCRDIPESIAVEMKQVLRYLLEIDFDFDFDKEMLIRRNNKSQSAIALAIMCHSNADFRDVLDTLLNRLNNLQTVECLKQLQICNCNVALNPSHDEEQSLTHHVNCTMDYNLLMLALSTGNFENINMLTKIVLNAPTPHKQYLLYGHEELSKMTYFNTVPNSLRVAAMYGMWEFLERMLSSPNIPASTWLEYDERTKTALHWLLQHDNMTLFEQQLKSVDFVASLKESLEDKEWRESFLHCEMSVRAVNQLCQKGIPELQFLLPKPSCKPGLSAPAALIFSNTCGNWKTQAAETVSKRLENTLIKQGWPRDNIVLKHHWTISVLEETMKRQLRKVLSRASMLLVSITTHGKDEAVAAAPNPGETSLTLTQIHRLLKLVEDYADSHIPKIVVIDTCREIDEPEGKQLTQLRANNTILLMSTNPGSSAIAGLYLGELTDKIAKADSSMTMAQMHMAAAENVKSKEPSQIPEYQSKAKDIVLRNWTNYKGLYVCGRCSESIRHGENYVYCGACLIKYHVDADLLTSCAGDLNDKDMPTISKPKVEWFCQKCHEKRRMF